MLKQAIITVITVLKHSAVITYVDEHKLVLCVIVFEIDHREERVNNTLQLNLN